jgi:hypothetical protein
MVVLGVRGQAQGLAGQDRAEVRDAEFNQHAGKSFQIDIGWLFL